MYHKNVFNFFIQKLWALTMGISETLNYKPKQITFTLGMTVFRLKLNNNEKLKEAS